MIKLLVLALKNTQSKLSRFNDKRANTISTPIFMDPPLHASHATH